MSMNRTIEDDIPFYVEKEEPVPGVPGGTVKEDEDWPGMWVAKAPGLGPCYSVTRREAVAALQEEARQQ